MLDSGMTLAESLEPPCVPKPFLYRPFEANASSAAQSREPPEGAQSIDDNTCFLMRVTCGACSRQHWLPAQEAPNRRLLITVAPKLHAPGCALAHHTHALYPSLRRVAPGYQLPVLGSGSGSAPLLHTATARLAVSGAGAIRVSLVVQATHVLVTECQPIEGQ